MSQDIYIAKAPATFMIAGEHAVLHGEPAIVGAIAKRLIVRIIPRNDAEIIITSDRLGQYKTSINNAINLQQPFHFVLGVLKKYQNKFPCGFNIDIHSEFSHQVGFGSSAAITVATIHAIKQWLNEPISKIILLKEGRNLVRKIQGIGSGADVAASVYGGIVYYEQEPIKAEVITNLPKVNLIYIGYKTPTAEVVNLVQRKKEENPDFFNTLFKKIGNCTKECKQAINDKNYEKLGKLFTYHHKLQSLLGVTTKEIEEIIKATTQLNDIFGCKISGSGLGDCILALGDMPTNYFPMTKKQQIEGIRHFPVYISEQGVSKSSWPEKWILYG